MAFLIIIILLLLICGLLYDLVGYAAEEHKRVRIVPPQSLEHPILKRMRERYALRPAKEKLPK